MKFYNGIHYYDGVEEIDSESTTTILPVTQQIDSIQSISTAILPVIHGKKQNKLIQWIVYQCNFIVKNCK